MRKSTLLLVTGQGTRSGDKQQPLPCVTLSTEVILTPVSLYLPQMHRAAVIAAILDSKQIGPKCFSVLLKGDGRRAVLKPPSP